MVNLVVILQHQVLSLFLRQIFMVKFKDNT
jgi:hypothetical protein